MWISAKCSATLPVGVLMLFQLLPINFDLLRVYTMLRVYTGDSPKTDPTRTYRFQRQILPYSARLYLFFENPQILIVRCVPNLLLARSIPFLG